MTTMKTVPNELVTEFTEACREAAAHGLMRCSSGNMSWRVDEKRMLVTATRSWMSRLSPEDVVISAIEDGAVLSGKAPTAEVTLHAGILRVRPDVNVVMHFQTPYATALACRPDDDINYFVIPEIPFYIGPVAKVPYYSPGSEVLAKAVSDAIGNHDMVLMANHGQVTVARDFDHAIQNAEFFELACEIILHGGEDVVPIAEEAVSDLLAWRQAASRSGV
jgi:ribulose-5-phosphate 4-epimerase/fuculose-1-phosphate aldolase